jgi:hypothetical protein
MVRLATIPLTVALASLAAPAAALAHGAEAPAPNLPGSLLL